MLNLIIFVLAIVLVVVIGSKTKINMGILGIIFAILIAIFRLQLPAVPLFRSTFNTTLFYNIISACLFYGISGRNGTFDVLAGKIVYAFRKATWAIPLLIYAITAIITLAGCDDSTLIMSPIAYGLAIRMGFDPFIAIFGVWCGGVAFLLVPWTMTGMINGGFLVESYGREAAFSGQITSSLIMFVFLLIVFLIVCFINKAFKIKGDTGVTENPQFNANQKKTLTVIIVAICIIIIPTVIEALASNPVTMWITSYLSFPVVCFIGSAILFLTKVADAAESIRGIPWSLIVTLVGMTMLFGLCNSLGIVDLLNEALLKLPSVLIAPGMALIGAFLSFFVSGAILSPLFLPLASTMASAAGVSLSFMINCVSSGCAVSCVSPVSLGGAQCLTGVSDDAHRSKIAGRMAKMGIIQMFTFAVAMFIVQFLFKA